MRYCTKIDNMEIFQHMGADDWIWALVALTVVVLISRMVGAWMLRIDEVIRELRKIRSEITRQQNEQTGADKLPE